MSAPLPPVFYSMFHYAACKRVGADWPKVRDFLFEHPDQGAALLGVQGLSFETLNEMRHLCTCVIHCAANTYIPRARCIAAGHFLRGPGKDCDVWVSVDDDTYADRESLRKLVTACRATRGLVGLPYASRDGMTIAFAHVREPSEEVARGVVVRPVDRIGQGCVAMHRDMVASLDAVCPPSARFRDRQDPSAAFDCPGIFRSEPYEGDWLGEDYYVCELARAAGLRVDVLLEAWVDHAGLVTKLDMQGQLCIVGADNRARLEAGIRAINERAAGAHG